MKKLMTVMAAATLGFFAQAADEGTLVEAKETFENGTVGEPFDISAKEEVALWWSKENPTKVAENNTGVAALGNKYAEIETDESPLYRTLCNSNGIIDDGNLDFVSMDSVYLDSYVRFAATEGEPAVDEDAQIAVWLQVDEIDEETSTTNLMVRCGKIGGDYEASPTNVRLNADIAADSWHRLTIKSILDTTSGEKFGFFAIFIDGKKISAELDEPLVAEDVQPDILNEENLEMVARGLLFPSTRLYNQEDEEGKPISGFISALGFSGNGAIDNVNITKTEPFTPVTTYQIAYHDYGSWADGFKPTTEYTENDAFSLPVAENIEPRAGGEFKGWTNEVGEVVAVVEVGTTGNLNFYAFWESAGTDPVAAIITDKVDGYADLSADDQKKVHDNVQYLNGLFDGDKELTEAWIAIVYGEGAKIPASKFVATTEELIAISFKYDLPILTTDVNVETSQADDGAFTFKIVDEGEGIKVEDVDNAKKMIEWSDDLDNFAVTPDQVDVVIDDDDMTIKATFAKPNDEAKGFMRLRLSADAE